MRQLIKCLVWDLDNTLWRGIAIEGPDETIPTPDERMLEIIALLEKRGIVSSVASRNDPSLLDAVQAHPSLSRKFVAPQVSWEPKSASIQRIAAHLNIGLDAIAFVDDSPFERAEVAYMLPEVAVLSPEQLESALASPLFNPARTTEESAQRASMYRQEEERRQAEGTFGGSRADFLRWCDMRLSIAPAKDHDLPRIIELTERTHQLNSTGRSYSPTEIAERVRGERWLVPVARLADRFGAYGMIGAAIVDTRPYPDQPPQAFAHADVPDGVWLAELVMLSCRVEGRGIPAALLRWLMGEARRAGALSLHATYRINERNLPIRVLFKQMGFARLAGDDADGLVTVARNLTGELPEYPEWLRITGGP